MSSLLCVRACGGAHRRRPRRESLQACAAERQSAVVGRQQGVQVGGGEHLSLELVDATTKRRALGAQSRAVDAPPAAADAVRHFTAAATSTTLGHRRGFSEYRRAALQHSR